MRQLLHQIRVLLAHILRIATEHADRPIFQFVHLCAFAVVLVFACELLVLKAVEHLADRLGRLCEHRLQGHAWREFALFAKLIDTDIEQCGNNEVVAGKLADGRCHAWTVPPSQKCRDIPVDLLDNDCGFLKPGSELVLTEPLIR